jgi:hypothetical protein
MFSGREHLLDECRPSWLNRHHTRRRYPVADSKHHEEQNMQASGPLADPETGTLDGLVDLAEYPLDHAGSPQWSALTATVRQQLETTGAATLPGFLTDEACATVAGELAAAVPYVPIRRHRASVYSRADIASDGASDGASDCASDDPRLVELEWIAGHVTRDMIPPFAYAHRLYVSADFKRFIAASVGREHVFEYADPLAGLVATVLPPGGRYPWHYDTNEFVVTIMIQPPESGGEFQYCKDLRSPGDENFDGLRTVLDGSDLSGVQSLTSAPGDLQLFLGRYSLHQVTEVHGQVSRHVLVLSYADRPGVIGPLDRTRSVYGRVTEAHLVAATHPVTASDGLIL